MDFRKVPIRQETIEVCEIFDINPYRLESEGSVLLGIRGGQELVQKLRQEGNMAEIIGRQTMETTGFCTAVPVSVIWNVRERTTL